jgi:ABC-type nickel/cobalt efflux system permease component RcnA
MNSISILTSVGLGAIHALEPGHGKAFLFSYLTGNDIKKKNLLVMSLSMAISHSFLLLFLALIVPFFFNDIEEEIHKGITVIASLSILYIGSKMLINAINKKNENCNCSFHSTQNNDSKQTSSLFQQANFSSPNQSLKINPINIATLKPVKKTSLKESIFTGFINGIIPCPSALVVIAISFTNTNYIESIFVLLAYVIGFTGLILLFSIALLLLKSKIKLKSKSHKFENLLAYITSSIVILSGFYYLYIGLNHHH